MPCLKIAFMIIGLLGFGLGLFCGSLVVAVGTMRILMRLGIWEEFLEGLDEAN